MHNKTGRCKWCAYLPCAKCDRRVLIATPKGDDYICWDCEDPFKEMTAAVGRVKEAMKKAEKKEKKEKKKEEQDLCYSCKKNSCDLPDDYTGLCAECNKDLRARFEPRICTYCNKNPKDSLEDYPGMCSECRQKRREQDTEESDSDYEQEWRDHVELELFDLSRAINVGLDWDVGSLDHVIQKMAGVRAEVNKKLDRVLEIAMEAKKEEEAQPKKPKKAAKKKEKKSRKTKKPRT
jgi:hypothetical protein